MAGAANLSTLDTVAGISGEEIDGLRARIGYAATSQLSGRWPYYSVATSDGFRHFANGYGDDNPLFCDPGHGARSGYGAPIAPPTFVVTMGVPLGPKAPPEVLQAAAGALRNAHAFQAGSEWEFYRPLYEGARLATANVITDVETKQSRFGGGRSVIVHHRQLWWREDPVDETDRLVASYRCWFVNTDRRSSSSATKERVEGAEPRYTPEMLAAIDAAYEAEERRGARPRLAADVQVGEDVAGVVKGPLTVTDMITFHMGWGWSGQGMFASRLGWLHRRTRPGLWRPNRFGAPDVVQRVHWDDDMARGVGAQRAYDYGFLRSCWFIHALTNWMGDEGWVWRYGDRMTGFNYVGDTTWIKGTVVATRAEEGQVDVTLEARNQDDRPTASASATVLLPARAGDQVVRPDPDDEVLELLARCRAAADASAPAINSTELER
jgi:acyl dehydratase